MKQNKFKAILTILITILVSTILFTGCHERYDLEKLAREDAEAQAQAEANNPSDTTESGDDQSQESTGDNAVGTSQGGSQESSQGSSQESSAGSSQSSSTQSGDSQAADESAGAPSSILGNTTSNSYSNSFYGLKFTAPNDNWYIATDSELAQVMNKKTINNDVLLQILNETGFIMDMFSIDTSGDAESDTFDRVSITIEDIGKLYGVLMTEQELAEASLASTREALTSQGAKNAKAEVIETVFSGSPRACISSSADLNGSKIYQKQIYIKKDSYIACVTAISYGQDRTEEIIKAFTAL